MDHEAGVAVGGLPGRCDCNLVSSQYFGASYVGLVMMVLGRGNERMERRNNEPLGLSHCKPCQHTRSVKLLYITELLAPRQTMSIYLQLQTETGETLVLLCQASPIIKALAVSTDSLYDIQEIRPPAPVVYRG